MPAPGGPVTVAPATVFDTLKSFVWLLYPALVAVIVNVSEVVPAVHVPDNT